MSIDYLTGAKGVGCVVPFEVTQLTSHLWGRFVHVRGRPIYSQRPGKEIFRPRNLGENSKVGLSRGLPTCVDRMFCVVVSFFYSQSMQE